MEAYLGSSFEVLELLVLGEAPKGGAYAQVVGLAEAPGLLVDLLGQLARGGHYDGDGPPALLQLRLVHDVHQHRQHKRCCLA